MNRSLLAFALLLAPLSLAAQNRPLSFEELEGIDVVLAFDDPTPNRVLESAFRDAVANTRAVNLISAAEPNTLSLVLVATCEPVGCETPEVYSVAVLLSNHYDATWALELLSHESQELADLYAPRVAELMEPRGIWAEVWHPDRYAEEIDAFVAAIEARCIRPLLATRGVFAALAVGDTARARALDEQSRDPQALC